MFGMPGRRMVMILGFPKKPAAKARRIKKYNFKSFGLDGWQ
jgi:hypothetical protein